MFREDRSKFRDCPTIQPCRLVGSDSQGHGLELPPGDCLGGLHLFDGDRPESSVGILPWFVPDFLPSFSKDFGNLAGGALP
eukprot:14082052-Heterocapsa_arctica.AAC.1